MVMVRAKAPGLVITNDVQAGVKPVGRRFWHVKRDDYFVKQASRRFGQLRQQSLHLTAVVVADHRKCK